MITKISGKLDSIKSDSIIVENGGFYYQIFVANNILNKIRNTKKSGDDITLYTLYYFEGNVGKGNQIPRLIGFLEELDREFFEHYITVRGLGEKKALRSLILPIRSIALAIENEDKQTLRELPGIGSRMADKIIAELKGKLVKFALMKKTESISKDEKMYDFKDEAMEVLLQLDYRRVEAENLISSALKRNNKINTAEDLIKEIFKQRNK
ncbi:hypothetical protein DRQ09_04940 [candidate division KSB1 bacterium]|nr:MAG: hypothetical protein DRQ09_04940 [candidate division KSB1 bacterium]